MMNVNDPHPAIQFLRQAAGHLSAGKTELAIAACQEALKRFPDHAQSHYALAVALSAADRADEAIISYQHAVRLKPDFFEAWTNLGGALGRRGRMDEAVEAYSQAARIRPDVAEMHANLSNALREAGRITDAEVAAKKTLAMRPDLAEAHVCYGAVLTDLGRYQQAIDEYHEAIRLKPDLPGAHFNLSFVELMLGNWQRGWPKYEWRRKSFGAIAARKFSQPDWDGKPLNGKTILLHCEQGFGDAMQFVRYALLVTPMGGRVVLEAPTPLVRLFHGIPGIEKVVATGEPLPKFDVQIPLPSLPGLFNTTPQTIPASIPYLSAEPETAENWRKRINPSSAVRQIGLAWTGSVGNRNDRNRSIPLEKLSPLGTVNNVRFHSLQITPPPPDAGIDVADWSLHLTDFAETAGLIANLDLVIAVDTAVAHLAGAMGKPAWLPLSAITDWRWLLHPTDTAWYPTMRLFRQKTLGDWDEVIRKIVEELDS